MIRKLIPFVCLILISATILLFLFKPVLTEPSSYVYSKSGDALKSYYNFSYFLKYGRGIKHNGINYPYGDHLQYINSHPLYVHVLKFVDKHIISIRNYGVAILNLTMIISLLLAFPFLYLILRHFGLPGWYAVIIALIIGFLTPQFDRIKGHFEMVYAFFIPMFWYLLILWKKGKKKWLWAIVLVLGGLVGGFTSAYYAAFYVIFLLAVLVVDLWNHRKSIKPYIPTGIALFIIAIFPVVAVKGLVAITDWVNDRPENPWGFFVFHSNIYSIFLPFISPLKRLVGDVVDMNFEWEGRAYVGLPATILAIAITFMLINNIISKQKISWRMFFPRNDSGMNNYLVAAFLVLLFAMCIPFDWGLQFLVKVLPPVKQFRCLGRFSWIFYYVFTVYTAYFYYRLFRYIRSKKLKAYAILLLMFVLSYWTIDAGTNIQRSTKDLFSKNDVFEVSGSSYLSVLEKSGIDPSEFQAIFFLPFSNTCGDKLLFHNSMNGFVEGMKCSYYTSIPIVESFSPRLSFTHALSSIQMLADSAIYKTRLDDMNDKPLLLLYTRDKMNEREEWLISRSNLLYEGDKFKIAELPVEIFHTAHKNWKENAIRVKDSLKCNAAICSDTDIDKVIYNGFEDKRSKVQFSGKFAIYEKNGSIELYNGKIPFKGKTEISYWLYVDTRTHNMPGARLYLKDEKGNIIEERRIDTREVNDVYNQWVRISLLIDAKPEILYQLVASGKFIAVDDMLIKPAASDVLVNTSTQALFNNFPLDY
ncbi:MAG: hypothetical protein JW894_01425 [Bacteroidales bacterium]|nr:hypothetical protein [Bacteroidales bacterium]